MPLQNMYESLYIYKSMDLTIYRFLIDSRKICGRHGNYKIIYYFDQYYVILCNTYLFKNVSISSSKTINMNNYYRISRRFWHTFLHAIDRILNEC